MTDFIPQLLGSGIVGAVGGFVMSYAAQQQRFRAEHEKALLDRIKASDASADNAAKRQIDGGKTMRYIVIACLMFATVVAVFLMPLVGIRIFVRDETVNHEWLFGLIPSTTTITYTGIPGYFLVPVLLDGTAAAIGFLFGAAAARGKA